MSRCVNKIKNMDSQMIVIKTKELLTVDRRLSIQIVRLRKSN